MAEKPPVEPQAAPLPTAPPPAPAPVPGVVCGPRGGVGGAGPLSWMSELSRALDLSIQTAGTFLETNSALLANTLALDKLSEFDGAESLKVIYSEDPEALQAMTALLLLQEQTRSMGELAMNYSHALAEFSQSGQMFGDALQKLAMKRDPRQETLWETSWHASTLDQLISRGGSGANASAAAAAAAAAASAAREPPAGGLPPGLSTLQQLLHTLGAAQCGAHARLLEQAEASPGALLRALDALKEAYAANAVAHRHLPEEAARFEAEAAMWRSQWEGASPELVHAARGVVGEHGPRITKCLAAFVQAQLKSQTKVAAALQREEYKLIDIQ